MESEKKPEAEMSDAERKQQLDLKKAGSFKPKNPPLVTNIYTADPSAHVFNEKIYIYPSHDIETDSAINDDGDHFAMRDYHVLSIDNHSEEVTDHGVALSLEDIKWASKQLWAPDAAEKSGQFYFYFPARDYDGIFRIGVAISDTPSGPFKAQENYIEGSFSIDPAVFKDDDGSYYLYFGGLWGGQLQNWRDGKFSIQDSYPADNEPALPAKMAKLSDDMLTLAEPVKDIVIVDESGAPITTGDNERRFFEASWLHKYQGKYYFSYSTGDTHKIAYGIADNPYGPFVYQGVILNPVLGWTNHHSIVFHQEKWWLFYHDSSLSSGKTHLRCVKKTELIHDINGKILPITAYD
ncbi:glycoside hydrolase family 43 protein [Shewanella japonica]|uniref:Alpha-N-arabinofuranosidase n=1 Tax=Shewanella japonica TaxID=93973 RepID=A0ABN4YD03_9GAMM|nr:alpha-N-arabinofuranosidase [Shewanella japonica]